MPQDFENILQPIGNTVNDSNNDNLLLLIDAIESTFLKIVYHRV